MKNSDYTNSLTLNRITQKLTNCGATSYSDAATAWMFIPESIYFDLPRGWGLPAGGIHQAFGVEMDNLEPVIYEWQEQEIITILARHIRNWYKTYSSSKFYRLETPFLRVDTAKKPPSRNYTIRVVAEVVVWPQDSVKEIPCTTSK